MGPLARISNVEADCWREGITSGRGRDRERVGGTVAQSTAALVVAPFKLYEVLVAIEQKVASIRAYWSKVPGALVAYFGLV